MSVSLSLWSHCSTEGWPAIVYSAIMAAPAMPSREQSFFIPMEAVEELNCPVCLESKVLLLLPCQHRCCSECVEKLAHVNRRRITCPQCRADAVIPPRGFPVCRLSQYFREQLQQCNAQSGQGQATRCHYCTSAAEARCSDCDSFACYKCCTKRKCQTANHKITDVSDLTKQADTALQSWLKKSAEEVKELSKQKLDLERKLKDKEATVQLLESKLSPRMDKIQKVLFVDKMSKKTEAEVTQPIESTPDEPELEEDPLGELKRINLSAVLMQESCTSVCFTSCGDAVAGTVNGDLHMYDDNDKLIHSCMTTGGVWSLCEYKKLVYAQCGDSTIDVYKYNLSEVVRTWEVGFTPTQVAVSNNTIYIINLDNSSIVKFSLTGEHKGTLCHPSFVYPYSMKPLNEDSIAVCDYRANAVFLFRQDCCIWQLAIENCSGIAVDWKNNNIWVKIYNKRSVTVLSDKGDRMGIVGISGQSSGVAYDMAANGHKLYLATEYGLLTSSFNSRVCVIS